MGRSRRMAREASALLHLATAQEIERKRECAFNESLCRVERELRQVASLDDGSAELRIARAVTRSLVEPHRFVLSQAICCLRRVKQRRCVCPHTLSLNELQDRMQSAVKAFENDAVSERVDASPEGTRLAKGDAFEWSVVRTSAILTLTRFHADLLMLALALNALEHRDLLTDRVGSRSRPTGLPQN